MRPNHYSRSGGLPMALGAYLLWGLLPLYLGLLRMVPSVEVVGWRMIFALPVSLLAALALGQGAEVRAALSRPKSLAMLCLSGLLIGGNWLTYVTAVTHGYYFATSLGYFIIPLLNILLGTVLLGERLSARQWLAVGLAVLGVALLALNGRDSGGLMTLAIALTLAGSFGGYGLVRRWVPVGSLVGLAVEAMVLLGPALALLSHTGGGLRFAYPNGIRLWLVLLGALTPLPLVLFAEAARRLEFSTLGFIQFLSPTTVFLLGLLVFHEPLKGAQLPSFLIIWTALGVFLWDLWGKRRAA